MVHPYLKNRLLPDSAIDCPPELWPALGRTKGVPIFQEQVMQIAMLAADFTPGEADALRRAMAAWKRRGGLSPFHQRLVGRMVEKGYDLEYAERIFKQIEGFGEYGFPESHAAGFALLAYVSSWIKRHHPDAFLCGLLNAWPMGFYAPAQLVRDAREHGVEVREVDVTVSGWESALEGEIARKRKRAGPSPARGRGPGEGSSLRAVRLGLNRINGLAEESALRIVAARAEAPFASVEDLARRARLDAKAMADLAGADALHALTGHRHQAAWAVAGIDTRPTEMLRKTRTGEEAVRLAPPERGRDHARRLPLARPHPEAPSAVAAARQLAEFKDRDRRAAARLPARPAGAGERPRHAPAAARDGQGHGLRHPRGRDRRGQRHRLAEGRRAAEEAAARRDPAHRLRPVAAPGRGRAGGDAPARVADDRPHAAAAGAGEPQPRLPLSAGLSGRSLSSRWRRTSPSPGPARSRSARPGRGRRGRVACKSSELRISLAVQCVKWLQTSAATPETCGVAIEVPE
jgi:hypothetical protein